MSAGSIMFSEGLFEAAFRVGYRLQDVESVAASLVGHHGWR